MFFLIFFYLLLFCFYFYKDGNLFLLFQSLAYSAYKIDITFFLECSFIQRISSPKNRKRKKTHFASNIPHEFLPIKTILKDTVNKIIEVFPNSSCLTLCLSYYHAQKPSILRKMPPYIIYLPILHFKALRIMIDLKGNTVCESAYHCPCRLYYPKINK